MSRARPCGTAPGRQNSGSLSNATKTGWRWSAGRQGPATRLGGSHAPRTPLCIDLVSAPKSSSLALIIAAVGVVYGDIGTSVLYAVKEVFGHGHVQFTVENVYGILSMFFWTLTIIVSRPFRMRRDLLRNIRTVRKLSCAAY